MRGRGFRRKSVGDPAEGAVATTGGSRSLEEGEKSSPQSVFKFRQWINRKRRALLKTGESSVPPVPQLPQAPPDPTLETQQEPSTSTQANPGSTPQLEASEAFEAARKLLGEDFDVSQHMRLERFTRRRAAIGPFYESGFQLHLRNMPGEAGGVAKLWTMIRAILAQACLRMLSETQPDRHRGQLVASHDNLFSDKSTRWSQLSELSMNDLIAQLEAAKQSDDGIDLEGLVFTLRYADPTETVDSYGGGPEQRVARRHGGLGRRFGGVPSFAKLSKLTIDPTSVLALVDGDNHCLPAACVIGAFLSEEPASGRLFNKVFLNKAFLRTRMYELIERTFGEPRQGPFLLEHAKRFAETLDPVYRILCFTQQGAPLVTYGPGSAKSIHLFFFESHVWVIPNIQRFVTGRSKTKKWMCTSCYGVETMKMRNRHRCEEAGCQVCKHSGCPNVSDVVHLFGIRCVLCKMMFHTVTCKDSHEARGDCAQPKIPCERCGAADTKSDHSETCGTTFCYVCKGRFAFGHRCFMTKLPLKDEKIVRRRWYLDFETQTRKRSGEHQPNLLVAQMASLVGEGKDGTEAVEPDESIVDSIVFRGLNCVQEFVQMILKEEPSENPFLGSYCLFHNLSSFDGKPYVYSSIYSSIHSFIHSLMTETHCMQGTFYSLSLHGNGSTASQCFESSVC